MKTQKEGKWLHATPKQRRFLACFVEVGTVNGAAAAAKCSPVSHYTWLKKQPYAGYFEEAREENTEALEAEAIRRAVYGVEEPVIYQGKLQYEPRRDKYGRVVKDANGDVVFTNKPLTVRRPSDILTMFLLKSKRPAIYRDNTSLELAGPGGAPLSITVKYQRAKDGRPA